MKRATLSAYPTSQPSPPPDLTDRLLAREDPPSAEPPNKRRRAQPRGGRARPAPPSANPPASPEPTSSPAGPPDSLAAALAAAELAADALRLASREAPARYEVALRYRLDALAHHLQQVQEFVASLVPR